MNKRYQFINNNLKKEKSSNFEYCPYCNRSLDFCPPVDERCQHCDRIIMNIEEVEKKIEKNLDETFKRGERIVKRLEDSYKDYYI